jgi:hypothetical protein
MARDKDRQREYNRAYYQRNREAIRAQQSSYGIANRGKITAGRKGISAERFLEMLADQGGQCAICLDPLVRPHIDHDHSCCPSVTANACGSCVRALLCASCNHMIGKAHERPEVLEAGAAYLRMHAGSDR